MKIINIILAIGTAVVVAALLQLGIRAFHPEPVSPWENRGYEKMAPVYQVPCDKGDAACIAARDNEQQAYEEQQKQYQAEDKQYQAAMKLYNRDVFVIANIMGLIIFAIGFFLIFSTSLASQAAPVGIMMAGFWGIAYGYGSGWGSIGDQLKFAVGLVIAVILIGGSIWLMQRYAKKVGATS